MAPLSDMGDGLGARIATVSDPVTNLALRSRVWYNGDKSTVMVGLDCLFGGTTLDGNLEARLRNTLQRGLKRSPEDRFAS